ncbi:MAG: sodium-dependent transporter [Lawsonibacter sp.]|nr:sodium-dependent transporter [Lawsonibacter sp.]
MMEQHHRGQWGSNLGFLMATVGAAVGLGNIWSFPFRMGKNGGFPFLIIYLVLAVLVGFTIMLCELAIGRKSGKSVLTSYQKIGGKAGGFVGFLALLSPFLILSFYTVLGAYCIQYVGLNFAELLGIFSLSSISGAESFGTMLTNQPLAIGTTFLFIALCFLIIRGGIKDGIEKFNKVGMPALFIMLVIVILRSLTLPGAMEGLKFMFAPNFEPIKTDFIGVLSAAGGQMFFSLSLAMGITVTYGSYLSKKESLVRNSMLIIVSDTLVAVMAGMAVLPAAFALGGGESAALSGPKLLFITLQDVFNSMGPFGPIFGILFFLFVVLAAITSAIALTEVLVTFVIDLRIARGKEPKRNIVVAVICLVLFAEAAVVAADGLGANGLWVPFQSTGRDLGSCWLEFMDFISEGVAMPLGALIMSVLIGWVVGPQAIRDEVSLEGHQMSKGLYTFFTICVRIIAPVAMAFILYGQVNTFLAPV